MVHRRPVWLSVAAAVALLALAGMLRFDGLGRVQPRYWDEQFYAADAAAYIGREPATHRPNAPAPAIAEGTWMQPPLGKWMIAAGEFVAGPSPAGTRIAAAAAGTAGVLLTYLLGLELLGSILLAWLAGLLVALDGLHIVQSRIAMLDIFMSTFILLGCYCLARDVGALRAEASALPRAVAWRKRTWLIASGASFGAAIAVKWSAVPFLLVAAALAYRWEIRHDSRADPRRARPGWPAQRAARARPGWPAQRAARAQCLVIAAFVLVPAIVYLVSYATFFVQHGPDLRGFLRLQRAMADYGLHFHNQSPDQTAPWTWPFVFRPINYTGGVFFQGGISIVDGRVRVIRVLALGNPIVWWAFLAAVPLVAWRAIATRRGPGALVLVGYLVVWLPWLVISRTAFGYYMLPAVPFMGLAVATAMTALGPRGRAGAAAALAAAATIAAALYLPLWTAAPMSVQRFTQLHHLPGVR